ncbi:MAG: DUF4492 domain-containing protein [Bacteroidia bacterium]|nr:DUF4492 domain-containing protein [Bacteroidia bacterium]
MPDKSDRPVIYKVWRFYIDGFKDLSLWGRSVWIIILIKLLILFVIFRLFLMPDVLKKNFKTDQQRSRHVLENLTTDNR